MRKWTHKMCPMLLALSFIPAMLAPAAPVAEAKALQQVNVDGTRLSTAAINNNGSLLVPAVFLQKAGVTVLWNDARQAVVLQNHGIRKELTAGQRGAIHRPEGTYIPLRYAVESLGMQIQYDSITETAKINTGAAVRTMAAVSSKAVGISDKDQYWLAQLVEAEAGGEPHQGKVGVAAVILNRIDSPDWPNTIHDVIFQIVKVAGVSYYQFSPVLDGRIYKVKPSEDTYKAIREALDGADPTGGATVFYNPDKTENKWVREKKVTKTIGGHVFAL